MATNSVPTSSPVLDARAVIDLVQEGWAEEAEVAEGHAPLLSHPV